MSASAVQSSRRQGRICPADVLRGLGRFLSDILDDGPRPVVFDHAADAARWWTASAANAPHGPDGIRDSLLRDLRRPMDPDVLAAVRRILACRNAADVRDALHRAGALGADLGPGAIVRIARGIAPIAEDAHASSHAYEATRLAAAAGGFAAAFGLGPEGLAWTAAASPAMGDAVRASFDDGCVPTSSLAVLSHLGAEIREGRPLAVPRLDAAVLTVLRRLGRDASSGSPA